MSTSSRNTLTALLRTIGYPEGGTWTDRSPTESRRLLEMARENKVESLYLRALSDTGELDSLSEAYEASRQYQRDVVETCRRTVDLFEGRVDYAFVKSIHPFPADASDVDVALFDVDDVESLPVDFAEHGYEVLGTAPSAATIKDTETGQLVDLQRFFGLHKVVYYNHDRLAANVEREEIGGVAHPVPARPYDLSLVVNHSVTELAYLLKEYYATVYMLETRDRETVETFIEDVRFNRAEPGCRAFLGVTDALTRAAFGRRPRHYDFLEAELGTSSRERSRMEARMEAPYDYSRTTLTRFTLRKFRERQFRRSFLRQVPSFANPLTAGYILKKVYARKARDTY